MWLSRADRLVLKEERLQSRSILPNRCATQFSMINMNTTLLLHLQLDVGLRANDLLDLEYFAEMLIKQSQAFDPSLLSLNDRPLRSSESSPVRSGEALRNGASSSRPSLEML